MKKLLFIAFLLLASMSSYAQKSYIEVKESGSSYLYFFGEIPSEVCSLLKKDYRDIYYDYVNNSSDFSIKFWYWINLLSSYGYEIEFILGTKDYILSKPSAHAAAAVPRVQMDDEYDGEVKEVARYNLQGIPVKESEKGVQIVVYSNYTTKTVIVE